MFKKSTQIACELFNLYNASLRNVIELVFGVLKKCFPIAGSSTELHLTQKKIIFACYSLYNYLMDVDPNDTILTQVDNELRQEVQDKHQGSRDNNEETIQGKIIRDDIEVEIWITYTE